MSAVVPATALGYAAPPPRYRSLQTLLLLAVLGSIVSSVWLMPSRLERVAAATERGDQALVHRELDSAAHVSADPGETRALVDVALTLGEPETAAAILEQALVKQPDSLEAMRLLLEVERQRHRIREVAALDERIYRRTGEPDALREAADIYASQRMIPERIDALRRLDAAGRATSADMAELAHRLDDAGAGRDALGLVMSWLDVQTAPLSPEIVALAAGLSATDADAEATATQLGVLIGRAGEEGPLHVLIQTYTERGRPSLSLVAGQALGAAMQARPEVALLLAELEALEGKFVAARHRLDQLEAAGTLLPAGLPMLAELELQAGDLSRAVALFGSLSTQQIPETLSRRLVDAVFAARRTDLLARLAIDPIVPLSPGSAAVIALARGDRTQAVSLARTALGAGADLADLGPAFSDTIRALGLERTASEALALAARKGALGDDALSFLLEIAASPRADGPALLQALRSQRDLGPRGGAAWAAVAARLGKSSEVTAWLQSHASQMPTETLLGLLTAANEHSDPGLARAAGSALSGRTDLPDGWSPEEVAFTAHTTDPLTAVRLRDGMTLIGAPDTAPAARDRLIGLLVGAREFARVAQSVRLAPTDRAVAWLESAATGPARPEIVAARLGLLASLAPQQALAPLAQRWTTDPARLLPLYATALLQSGKPTEARDLLVAGTRSLAPKQQDAVLQDALARVPAAESLPVLRVGAASGRADWVAAYQAGLSQAGLIDELRADLRARAEVPGMDLGRRQALASRLVELNDRAGAITILKTAAAGRKPDDPTVEQLLYLWGPRGDPESVAWARERATSAPIADLPKWLDHLAYLGSPQAVQETVDSRPAVLAASAAAVRTYGASLIATHTQAKPDLRPAIATATAPDRLLALAQLALDTGQAPSAWQAAREAVARSPRDPAALLLAAQAAASVHRSDDAASLYTRLLALGPQSVEVSVDIGDALLNAKRVEAGRRALADALTRLPTDPATLAEARLRARALLLLHREEEGAQLLRRWLGRYPDHAGLKADLLQIRLDNAGDPR